MRRWGLVSCGVIVIFATTAVFWRSRLAPDARSDFTGLEVQGESGQRTGIASPEVVETHTARTEDAAVRSRETSENRSHGAGTNAALTDEERDWLTQNDTSEQTLYLGIHTTLIGTTDLRRYAKDIHALLGELRRKEPNESEVTDGLVLTGVRSRSYIAQLYRVQRGDEIVSVNGVAVTSITQGIRWAREHPSEKYTIVLRRKGKEITRTLLVPKGD